MDKPDLYDPQINRSFAELAAHYGTLVDPARAFKPKDKPRVERPMPYVRDSFWRGRAFTTLQDMQSGAVRWCREVAGAPSSRALDGAAPAVVFAAVEAPALGPLPTTEFVLATWSAGKVGPDSARTRSPDGRAPRGRTQLPIPQTTPAMERAAS